MIRVCVLLAAYNGEKYIKEQLDSILSQQGVELDIYISLDVSTDSTYELISSYFKEKNVHVLEYGEQFGSAGRNFFHLLCEVDFSAYDYISFSDQDDIWLPNKLEVSISCIHAQKSDAYSGNVTAFWFDGRKALVKKDYKQVEFDYLFEAPGPGCSFVLSNKLAMDIKCCLLSKKEQIDKLWLHDWFCYSFARSNDYKWYIDSEPLMLYRQHGTNEVGVNTGLKAMIIRFKKVLSGEALDKVLLQACFLNQEELPIMLLKNRNMLSLFKLSLLSKKCRRKKSEQYFFSIALFLLSIKQVFK